MIQTDEDFQPAGDGTTEQSWGYPTFYDIRGGRKANPVKLGTFELPTTRQFPPPSPGDYTVHDPKIRGNTAFFSWYAEGVVAADLAPLRRGADVRMIAQWVTPGPNRNPTNESIIADGPAVWGQTPAGAYVLASDMNSGL